MKLSLFDKQSRLVIALVMLLFSNTCLYRLDTQLAYILLNGVSGALVFLSFPGMKIRISAGIMWLTCIFALFCVYGIFFLRAGSFNLDRFIISYIQCFLYYIIIRLFFEKKNRDELLALSCEISAILCILTMLFQEGGFIGRELRSVGNSLSGNVNTVSMALGIMTVFISLYYAKSKKLPILIIVIVVMLIMLLTGSKKSIVYIIADIFILYEYSRNKTIGKLIMLLLFSVFAYLIFGTEYFYELIGSRVIDMFGQLGLHVKNAHYSHSTDIRIYMIGEALRLWIKHPLFGGGANYFWANTISGYEYSHCNVTEILCTYGILGFALFYSPYLGYFRKRKQIKKNMMGLYKFSIIVVILALVIDWMAVTFSGLSICYMPVIYICVLVEESRRIQNNACLVDNLT